MAVFSENLGTATVVESDVAGAGARSLVYENDRIPGAKPLERARHDEQIRGRVVAVLDQAVNRLCLSLMMTVPGCLTKTTESVRNHKLAHWDRNRESNRAWLGMNMLTECRGGFKAFNEGSKGQREVDFIKLRQMLAQGQRWSDELIEEIMPPRVSK